MEVVVGVGEGWYRGVGDTTIVADAVKRARRSLAAKGYNTGLIKSMAVVDTIGMREPRTAC